jgi:PilZ domain
MNRQFAEKSTFAGSPMGTTERRSGVRHSCTAAAEIMDLQTHTRINGRTYDIDRGGCFIDSVASFPVGSLVALRLTKDNQTFVGTAKVVFQQAGMGMSLAFTSAEPEQLWIIENWIGVPSMSEPELATSQAQAPAPVQTSAHRHTKPALDIPSAVSTATAPSESTARLGSPSEPDQQHLTLKYLLLMLVQKSILSEDEGSALLGKLLN